MARNALIVDQSQTMRNILRNVLQANIGDLVVYDAEDDDEAIGMCSRLRYHFILYSWDMTGTGFSEIIGETEKKPESDRPCFILLVSLLDEKYITKAVETGVSRENIVLCQPAALVAAVHRICNPVSLRASKRYSIRGTTAILTQAGHSFEATVVNASLGGMLVDLEFAEQFRWHLPLSAHVRFAHKGNGDCARNIAAMVTSLSVNEADADHAPTVIRVALRFTALAADAREVLEKAFARAEKEEKALELLA